MLDLLQKVCDAYGPSGYEARVRDVIRAEVEGVVDEVRTDRLGNLLAIRRPRGSGGAASQKVLWAAHMDEIAVMVASIDDYGFARVAPVGFVNPNTLPGARVVFENGVEGTFGVEGAALPREALTLPSMFLDVGATSRADCPLKVGDLGVFRHSVVRAHGETRVLGHNFDDRAGVAVLIQALRELGDSPHTVLAAFTVQEEFSLLGAAAAAFGLEPDFAIAIDVTPAGDTPKIKPRDACLGAGPAITLKDVAVIGHPQVKQALIAAAERAGVAFQLQVSFIGTTDAMAIQTSRTGVPVGTLSLPARHIHTPTQMVDLNDLRGAVEVLKALVSS
ncbi:MAG: M20/M25/M40 family metallo-hydrolase [Anaerolineae bacterium]|nr:M20/M25/M40 family metallo-hydrolase [Anaerolineae bacterium]